MATAPCRGLYAAKKGKNYVATVLDVFVFLNFARNRVTLIILFYFIFIQIQHSILMSLNGFHNLLESLAYIIRQFEKKAENPDVEISPNCLFLSSEEHGQFYDFIPPQDQVIKIIIIIIIYACAYMYACTGVWGGFMQQN